MEAALVIEGVAPEVQALLPGPQGGDQQGPVLGQGGGGLPEGQGFKALAVLACGLEDIHPLGGVRLWGDAVLQAFAAHHPQLGLRALLRLLEGVAQQLRQEGGAVLPQEQMLHMGAVHHLTALVDEGLYGGGGGGTLAVEDLGILLSPAFCGGVEGTTAPGPLCPQEAHHGVAAGLPALGGPGAAAEAQQQAAQ